ncbi:MAG: YeeE/YedE family protein [Rhizobiales bacterium]|nr:YeeE/YedE family protein [Hyphomicrobiales bacterium]
MVTEFTPISALLGGALIGFAAAAMMLLTGRIAGISGIAARLLPPADRERFPEGLAFIIGLVAAPLLWTAATGWPVSQTVSANLPLMIGAGLLVGFGSVYGSGCTSGHGVCGLARLSPRSLVAVAAFMGTAALTVFLMRHVIGS